MTSSVVPPRLVLESIHAASGRKVGALVRRVSASRLDILICYRRSDGRLHHTENRIVHDDDPYRWTRTEHRDGSRVVDRTRQLTDPVDVVPAHAEWLLVDRLVRDDLPRLEFTMLDEGTWRLQTAALERDDEQSVVNLVVAGSVVSRHLVLDGEVLASDWGVVGTRPAADVQELMTGLDEAVCGIVRAFLDDWPRPYHGRI